MKIAANLKNYLNYLLELIIWITWRPFQRLISTDNDQNRSAIGTCIILQNSLDKLSADTK